MAQIPYLVSNIGVQEIMGSWPVEWHEPMKLSVGTSKGAESFVVKSTAVQKCKEEKPKVA